MKCVYKPSDKLSFEVESDSQKGLFKILASIGEVFGQSICGSCKSHDVEFVCRTIDDNDYYETKCKSCFCSLRWGQSKKGNLLFPKLKDEEGKYLPNNGWVKFQGKPKPE